MKQQYEDEIIRLRRELSGNSPTERGASNLSSTPQLPAPPSLAINGSLSNLESHFSSSSLSKRLKSDESSSARLSRGESPNDRKLDEIEVPSASKKEGYDWLIVYNPKVPRLINVDLLHNLDHSSVVCCVKFSCDGKFLATGSNHVAQVFEVTSGTKVCTLSEDNEKEGDLYIRSVCFSPDGKTLVTGAEDKLVRIWDLETKEIIKRLSGHEQDIYSLDYSADGKLIASGSGDHTIKVWDVESGECLHTLKPDQVPNRESGITSVSISPDSKTLIAGSLDQYVRIWDLSSGELIEKIEGHKNSVYSVSYSPSGNSFVSGSLDKSLKLWDVGKNGEPSNCKHNITAHKDFVLSVAYSPDEHWVVSGSKDRSVQFWDTQSGTTQLMLQGHKNSVISVALSPVGGLFASGSGDFRTRIWSYSNISKQ